MSKTKVIRQHTSSKYIIKLVCIRPKCISSQDILVTLIVAFFNELVIALNVGQYNIYNKRNNYQPTSILVFNSILYYLTFKI